MCFCFEDGIKNVYINSKTLCKILKSSIISKEVVGNSWDILNAILSHRYHSD